MKPKLKVFLKPKVKIGKQAWLLKTGICRADYYKNPSDDKIESITVVGYIVKIVKNNSRITRYLFENGDTCSMEFGWSFPSKKELKEFLKKESLKNK